ncbi:hypothetical protein ASPZODRAFT_128995 [Penicilliopsis zonata CBS 506.65]|uniref:Uncharacterized protein n=1 Tax=Penicilliopsis zonata CBS 506.65 TaxID=1073090 RepID=A0A1L9ST49_9EURO|nr:hypothetical protein ASPZODRAFT_128995 [Penicilliopsis zonata CBS 506.65]OJJ50380.1 hypothetical protein ASPZODRAFT_128995 [Penicilliopsis zonata CBS 506.65]
MLLLGLLSLLGTVSAGAINDFTCRSTTHPNPVVLLHGLGATWYEDLNYLQAFLAASDFCTFASTYGAYDAFPFLGGLKPINDSAAEIASYIRTVANETGASKIDLVGHSEGGFQTLYVPKFEAGIADLLDTLVAIAPPTHGTTFAGLYDLAYVLGNVSRTLVGEALDILGCPACNDLGPDGPAVLRLNDGDPIVQSGNRLTVIASTDDELVTPTQTAFVDETGVRNEYVQATCPLDPVGHIGEAYDLNVWNLVLNALEDTPEREFVCVLGSPGK